MRKVLLTLVALVALTSNISAQKLGKRSTEYITYSWGIGGKTSVKFSDTKGYVIATVLADRSLEVVNTSGFSIKVSVDVHAWHPGSDSRNLEEPDGSGGYYTDFIAPHGGKWTTKLKFKSQNKLVPLHIRIVASKMPGFIE